MLKVFVMMGCLITSVLLGQPKIIVGIAGGTGSGKTTLAEKIQHAFPYDSILISQDSYYKDLSHLSVEERSKENFDHPNALDFEMLRQHIKKLKNGESIRQPVYDFHNHTRKEKSEKIDPAQVIIVEGILLFAKEEIRDLFDLKIYLETDDDVRILRRIDRDMNERSRSFEQSTRQYLATVKPMHDSFVAPSKQFADIIVPNAKPNEMAFNLIVAKLHEDLLGLRPVVLSHK